MNKKITILLLIFLLLSISSCKNTSTTSNWPSKELKGWYLDKIDLDNNIEVNYSNNSTTCSIVIYCDIESFNNLIKQFHQSGYNKYYNEKISFYNSEPNYDSKKLLNNYYDEGLEYHAFYLTNNNEPLSLDAIFYYSGNIINITLSRS